MAEEIAAGMKCAKYMLFVTNFMFVMLGALLILIGCTTKSIYGNFETFMADYYFSPASLAIAIGIITIFVSLFGCVGAFKESTLLINVFAFFLALIMILEISASIAAYAMRGKIEQEIRQNMNHSIQDYNLYVYDKEIWDFTQQNLRCCGVANPEDWIHIINPFDNDDITLTTLDTQPPSTVTSVGIITNPSDALWTGPSSCCRQRYNQGVCWRSDVFKDGCLDAIVFIVSDSALLLGCGALAVAFIQLLGVIFACMLAKAVRRIKTQTLVERDENRAQINDQLGEGGKNESPTLVLETPTSSEA